MFRSLPRLFAVTALFVAPSLAAHAQVPGFTPAQKTEIIKIIRDALKTDPSILREAVGSLQADDDSRQAKTTAQNLQAKHDALFGDATDHSAGNPHGNVTLIEFYDPRCGFCRRSIPGIAEIIKHDPQLRLIYKDIPVLGPPSKIEASAILAAGKQNAYLPMQALLMAQSAPPDEALLRADAKHLDLNADKLIADMKSPEIASKLDANLKLARDIGITGTPTFVIGDQLLPGVQDIGELTAAIAAARVAHHS